MPKDLSQIEGRELAGRFKLIKLMGRGGYGAVFEATQISVGRRCAVKILAPQNGESDRVVARFKVEARATSRLNHPNTIVLYDFGQDEEADVLFLAMEYLEGRDLKAMILDGPISVEATLHIAEQMAASLDDANEQGIVHRDVKPHNVMITTRGKDPLFVKMIDFGIAKAMADDVRSTLQQLTMSGAIVGTPAYMSPEQVRGDSIDGRSDQYSLATCIYAMLTGRPPYRGSSPIDVATRHLTDRPKRVRQLNPRVRVTDAFESALLRAMARNPDDRFPTSGAFVDALAESMQVTDESTGEPTAPMPAQTDEGHGMKVRTQEAFANTAELQMPRTEHVMTSAPATDQLPTPSATEEMPRITGAIGPDAETPPMFTHTSTIPDEPGFTTPLQTGPKAELEIADPAPKKPKFSWLPAIVLTIVVVIGGVAAARIQANAEHSEIVVSGLEPVELPEQAPKEPTQPPKPDIEPEALEPRLPKADSRLEEPTKTPQPPSEIVESPPKEHKVARVAKEPPTIAANAVVATDVAASKKVRVQIFVRPWGKVYVDGKKLGESLRYDLKLSARKHRFVLKQDGEVKARKTVDVKAGQPTIVRLNAK